MRLGLKPFCVFFVALLFLQGTFAITFKVNDPHVAASSGKGTCIACTLILSVVVGLSEKYEEPISQFLGRFCDDFFRDAEARLICEGIVDAFGEAVIELVDKGLSPDEVCFELSLCDNPKCHLFPNKKLENFDMNYKNTKKPRLEDVGAPWDWIANLIKKLSESHEPIFDDDGDKFSTIETLRGSNWRGRDCDDGDSKIYPGRKVHTDELADYNCNGIFGADREGVPYKEKYCANSSQRGVVVLGGSACSHFEIPPAWVNISGIDTNTYDDVLSRVMNELDLPHKSWATGYVEEEYVSSIYMKMRERNRCNHRDFQNLGVNGAGTDGMKKTIDSFARNQTLDHPVLFLFSPFGDDICGGHSEDPLDDMISVEKFTNNLVYLLGLLDEILPAGSHVAFVGIVNGSQMGDHYLNCTHPLGVPVYKVYEYLSCLGFNPCPQWLTTNATRRHLASFRAKELNEVYIEFSKDRKYKNFDMHYMGAIPVVKVSKEIEALGYPPWYEMEQMDFFHPSQMANALFADDLFQNMLDNFPDAVGPVNPFNKEIIEKFGDQKGH